MKTKYGCLVSKMLNLRFGEVMDAVRAASERRSTVQVEIKGKHVRVTSSMAGGKLSVIKESVPGGYGAYQIGAEGTPVVSFKFVTYLSFIVNC